MEEKQKYLEQDPKRLGEAVRGAKI